MKYKVHKNLFNYFRYDSATDAAIASLTLPDVLEKINSVNTSGVFLVERNFTQLISGDH